MNCAVYIRTASKKHQDHHVNMQSSLINRYIENRDWSIYNQYIDTGSGTNKYNNLKKMIEDAQLGKFNIILASDASRLFRNNELSYQLKKLCKEQKVHIITLDNSIDTINGDYEIIGLFSWLYEMESQKLSNRIKAGKRATKITTN